MGSFHRRIVVATCHRASAGTVRAALEDDFHHFRVEVTHEVEHVVHLQGTAVRHPYSLCASATDPLTQLVGMRLDRVASAVTRATDASAQCTHLLDLAGLAIAAAATRSARRQYDIEVPDRVDGRTTAVLSRDRQPLLRWELHDTTITAPVPFVGISLQQGLARWALEMLSPDLAEAAIVLRRCAVISLGRHKNLDAQRHAVPTGRCHAQQPQRAALALRIVGSTWDFSARAGELCRSDAGWLAFADQPT